MNHREHLQSMAPGLSLDQAVAEAERCLLCHDAPCSKGCPAQTDPATFIRKFRMKNITGAIRTIKQNNVLGGACGVLCPTARLCEKECSATGIGRPIQIGGIQRFLIEQSWQKPVPVYDEPPRRSERVAVVGSGPAGLSCAGELARMGFAVTVFEARSEPGGVIRYGVPGYRFDRNFLDRELAPLKELGVEFRCDSPVKGPAAAEELLRQGFAAVFLATGLWGGVRLQKGANAPDGVYTSVEFLAALRSPRLDAMAAELAGKSVAVIGGGSVAMDCAESALKLGARDVYLVYRRSYTEMPAEPQERSEALAAGVHFLLLNQPKEFVVAADGRLQGLKLVRTRLGDADASGRRRPEELFGSEWVLEADLVVEAIGNQAEEGAAASYPNVACAGELIRVEPATGQTSVPGIFAGGDIVRGPALVVEAVQDGKRAAKAISDYLTSKEA